MRRATALIALAVVVGCSGSGGENEARNAGAGGSGGSPQPPAEIDQLCRAYCGSEEPNGPTCSSGGTAAECRDRCLRIYQDRTNPECPKAKRCDQSVQSYCVDEMMWHEYGCDVSFDCNDEFDECRGTPNERAACEDEFATETESWCELNCPEDAACRHSSARGATWGRVCSISCASDAECPNETYCKEGICGYDCFTPEECASGQTCNASRGRCESTDPGGMGGGGGTGGSVGPGGTSGEPPFLADCSGGPLESPIPNCQPEPLESSGDPYADCVTRINQLRWECQCLPPLQRWTEAESCADQHSEYDSTRGAHSGFQDDICSPRGWAQNECPGWGSTEQVITGCLQSMWDEGPGEPYSAHGHYINMTNPAYSMVACGFYETPDGQVWSVQNFQ